MLANELQSTSPTPPPLSTFSGCCSPFFYRLSCVFVVADIWYMIRSCGVSFSCSSNFHVVFLSNLFSFLLSLLFTRNFLGIVFLCSLKDLRPSPGCCSFSRVPASRLFPACTLKDLHHPPAVEIVHAFLPSTILMFRPFSTLGT